MENSGAKGVINSDLCFENGTASRIVYKPPVRKTWLGHKVF